jgi:hypothetical protein
LREWLSCATISRTEKIELNKSGEESFQTHMPENETGTASDAPEQTGDADQASPTATETPVVTEEITYHAVEKDGQVTAIWEMQGRKHLRTIDPRSRQGQEILRLYTSEHHDDHASHGEAAS